MCIRGEEKTDTQGDWSRVRSTEEGTSWEHRGKQEPLLSLEQDLDFGFWFEKCEKLLERIKQRSDLHF